jgi:hypothetical protein
MKQRGAKHGNPKCAFLWPRMGVCLTLVITISMLQSPYNFENILITSDSLSTSEFYSCLPGNLTLECIDYEATKLARAFPYRDRSTWCLPPDLIPVRKNAILRQGLILTKVPKAASSTSAGVALRITDRNRCHPAQWEHRLGSCYSGRIREKSFLFTSIRAPDDRAISSIFYHKFSVLRPSGKTRPTDRNILRELHGDGPMAQSDHVGTFSRGQGGFTLQYASLLPIPEFSAWDEKHPDVVKSPEQVIENVKRVIDDYDLLLVVDRMDESLVLMSLVLGIHVSDVIVADSKITGETFRMWKNKPVETSVCIPTIKSFTSKTVRSFLKQNRWRASNYGDYLLHAAATKSLDRTIELVGRERFKATLAEYKILKALADEQCADQVHLPCGPGGQLQLEKNKQSCYIMAKDFGCAHACVDTLLEKERRIQRNFAYIEIKGRPGDFKASLYA